MSRVLIGITALLLVAAVAFAASFDDVDSATYHGKTGLKKLTAKIDSNNALIEAGNQTVTSQSVTNGQAVTLSSQVTILTGIGGANDTTNTITLAHTADRAYTIVVAAASTNLIQIDDDGTTAALGSDWLGDGTDSIMLYSISASSIVKLSSSNN